MYHPTPSIKELLMACGTWSIVPPPTPPPPGAAGGGLGGALWLPRPWTSLSGAPGGGFLSSGALWVWVSSFPRAVRLCICSCEHNMDVVKHNWSAGCYIKSPYKEPAYKEHLVIRNWFAFPNLFKGIDYYMFIRNTVYKEQISMLSMSSFKADFTVVGSYTFMSMCGKCWQNPINEYCVKQANTGYFQYIKMVLYQVLRF